MTDCSRGSEWRKWDLHVHTPNSIIQNFGGNTPTAWNNFIKQIASLPTEVKVLGITDYLFIDGYEYLTSRREEIPNIDLIIPNIEFRLNTFSGTANNSKRHNLHIMFDPSVDIGDIKEQLLSCLSNGYKIDDGTIWQQNPTKRSLETLGQQIKSVAPKDNSIQSKSDLEVGFDNITYKKEEILKLLEKDCFKGKYILAIGYSEWDQSRWDQSAAEKRDLINSCNCSLTCLNDPLKISENKDDLGVNNLNNIIIHSSDAHKLEEIGQTLSWIKADTTFSGLRQTLNEPDLRLFIGDTPPNLKPSHKIVKTLTVTNSNGWFKDDFTLPLNSDLVSIIGGRGSGKSALAEAIAYGAGSKDESSDAFISKATKHAQSIIGTNIELEWADGQKTKFDVGKLSEDCGLVRYLPQGAVEDLCSHNSSKKLQDQIENVIFQALDDMEKMGASNFNELKNQVLSNFKFEKDQVLVKIKGINSKIGEIEESIKELPAKEKFLKTRQVELKNLTKNLPKLPTADKKGQEELLSLSGQKKLFENQIITLRSKYKIANDIESKVRLFKANITEFSEEIISLSGQIGLDPEIFAVELQEDVVAASIEKTKLDLLNTVEILKKGSRADVASILSIQVSDLSFDNMELLTRGIEDKQKETKAFETVKIKYQEHKKTEISINSQINALMLEIKKVKEVLVPEKVDLESERVDLYISYFKLLNDERNEIEKLYKPLQETLSTSTETNKRLVFEAKIDYRQEQHLSDGLSIIDRTRKGKFRDQSILKNELQELYDNLQKDNYTDDAIKNNLNGVLNSFKSEVQIEDQIRDNCSIADFYDWLFDPSYFEIISSMKFDGTDLYLLSPGQKGIILLILFLEIDKEDYRPLIIDQPEENLDNLSIYDDLIGFFRERKQHRQIIIVTHNPNLVVNTDSEQIIVANYNGGGTPRLSYSSGSLEDQAKRIPSVEKLEDGIIEQVCTILEGGDIAFSRRRNKYAISNKIKFK